MVLTWCDNWWDLETKSVFELQKELDCVDICSWRVDFTTCNDNCNQEDNKTAEDVIKADCINKCNETYKDSYTFDADYKNCISACD